MGQRKILKGITKYKPFEYIHKQSHTLNSTCATNEQRTNTNTQITQSHTQNPPIGCERFNNGMKKKSLLNILRSSFFFFFFVFISHTNTVKWYANKHTKDEGNKVKRKKLVQNVVKRSKWYQIEYLTEKQGKQLRKRGPQLKLMKNTLFFLNAFKMWTVVNKSNNGRAREIKNKIKKKMIQ